MRTEINGAIIIKYEDGSVKIIPAPIMLSVEEAEDLFGSESDDEEEEESDDDDEEGDDKFRPGSECPGMGWSLRGKQGNQQFR